MRSGEVRSSEETWPKTKGSSMSDRKKSTVCTEAADARPREGSSEQQPLGGRALAAAAQWAENKKMFDQAQMFVMSNEELNKELGKELAAAKLAEATA